MREASEFERLVANLFRQAGAQSVEHDVLVAGLQIDVLVRFVWRGIPCRLAVECKKHGKPVGPSRVHQFGEKIGRLRLAHGVDLGAIVSERGFTHKARLAAKDLGTILLEPKDVLISAPLMDFEKGEFFLGSEIYAAIDALDGTYLDEPREHFLRLVASVSRARKYSPPTEYLHLQKQCRECLNLAGSLGPSYQAIAEILTGVLLHDAGDLLGAEKRFELANQIAIKHQMRPLVFEAQFWLARCATRWHKYDQALELLESVLSHASWEPALANLRVKAQYWNAKIHWLACQDGQCSLGSEHVKRLVRDSLLAASNLGLINYAEGARALLGEMELWEGNAEEAARLLLLSERRTPYPQDRAKLQQLVEKALHALAPEVAASIKKEIANEPSFRIDYRGLGKFVPLVQICEHALWRFARFPRDRILPFVLSVTHDWTEGIRILLDNDELLDYCMNSDQFQSAMNGRIRDTGAKKYHSLRAKLRAATGRPTSSDIKRRLEMCRRIFLTGALVGDTGKNGGVSLVPLSQEAASEIMEGRDGQFQLSPNGRFAFNFTSRKRKTLDDKTARVVRNAVASVAAGLLEHCSARGAFPMSVDILIGPERYQVLEVHYPSRGFEVLYAPFRNLTKGARFPLEIYAGQVAEFIRKMGITSILVAHLDELHDESRRPRTEFYGFEFSRLADELARRVRGIDMNVVDIWSMTSRSGGRVQYGGSAPGLVILDDVDPEMPISTAEPQILLPDERLVRFVSDRNLVKQHCMYLGIPTPKWQCIRRGSPVLTNRLREEVGRFVVLKDQYHLPSWHPSKRRSEFLDLEDARHVSRLMMRAQRTDVLIEELITDSLDPLGHCGELRIHLCVSG